LKEENEESPVKIKPMDELMAIQSQSKFEENANLDNED
jgi:hypothetical protein